MTIHVWSTSASVWTPRSAEAHHGVVYFLKFFRTTRSFIFLVMKGSHACRKLQQSSNVCIGLCCDQPWFRFGSFYATGPFEPSCRCITNQKVTGAYRYFVDHPRINSLLGPACNPDLLSSRTTLFIIPFTLTSTTIPAKMPTSVTFERSWLTVWHSCTYLSHLCP